MGYYWIILLFPAFFGSSHGFCGAPPRLDFAEPLEQFLGRDNFTIGENVTYSCRPGFVRVAGNNNLTCLSNSTWTVADTFCTRRSCGFPGDTPNGVLSFTDTLFGSIANYTCDHGYNMISKKNYRQCMADGKWSNEVPVCEVQKCPPPYAITDGRYSPENDEYQYMDAVNYDCVNKTLALIGEKTLSCTANGNWSSDPPKCIVVECSPPEVENAVKESGFNGPYYLNFAVRFQCLNGFTMEGSYSVKCNVSSKWEPALPTCKRIGTQSPTTTTTKKPGTGGTTVSQEQSTTIGKNENNGGSTVTQKTTKHQTDKENEGGGNNVGAVVGGVISGIVGFLIAASAIIYVCWFKKKRGGGYIGPTGKNPDSGTSSSHQTPIEKCDMQQIGAQETP